MEKATILYVHKLGHPAITTSAICEVLQSPEIGDSHQGRGRTRTQEQTHLTPCVYCTGPIAARGGRCAVIFQHTHERSFLLSPPGHASLRQQGRTLALGTTRKPSLEAQGEKPGGVKGQGRRPCLSPGQLGWVQSPAPKTYADQLTFFFFAF